MKKLVYAMLLVFGFVHPVHALTGETGLTEELEFVAETRIPGVDEENLSLCHVTRSFRALGYALTSDIQRYALSSDNCLTEDRPFTSDQLLTAQSLDLIAPDIPAVAKNSLERNLKSYGLLAVVALALLAVILRRVKSLLGFDPNGQMRKKAALRIVSVMCHAANCDGLVGSKELALISQAAKRLTRRTFPTADIIRMADHVDMNLDANDYIAFGKGLRDREKDAMMRAAFAVTIENGRMLPAEYEFVTGLAYGLGIPGEDFRRLLNMALDDLDSYRASP